MTKNTIQVSGNKATMFVHQISPALIVFDVPESKYFVVIVAAAICINIDKLLIFMVLYNLTYIV